MHLNITSFIGEVKMNPTFLDATMADNSEYSGPTVFDSVSECVNLLLATLAYISSERDAKILKLRYGLIDGKKWTLEEIGRELGISRERVRQLEARSIRKLSRCTQLHSVKIDRCMKMLRSFGDRVGASLIDDTLSRAFSTTTGHDKGDVSSYVRLFLLAAGHSEVERQSLQAVDSCLVKALATTTASLSIGDLWDTLQDDSDANEALGAWPDLDLATRLQLVLHVEIDSDGSCMPTELTLLKLSSKERRLIALVRVIKEANEPLHFTEIARRVRALLTGTLTMSDRNVHAWLDRYKDYFKWAGPGIYGLSEWDIGVRSGNLTDNLKPARRMGIGDEIALLLSERKEPISLSYMEDHVLSRFEVNRESVYASITQDAAGRFTLMESETVALSSWVEEPRRHLTSEPRRRVRLPRTLRDAARTAAHLRASELSTLMRQDVAAITPAKATGHAVIAAALGMTQEFNILMEIAERGKVPKRMANALKGFSET